MSLAKRVRHAVDSHGAHTPSCGNANSLGAAFRGVAGNSTVGGAMLAQ